MIEDLEAEQKAHQTHCLSFSRNSGRQWREDAVHSGEHGGTKPDRQSSRDGEIINYKTKRKQNGRGEEHFNTEGEIWIISFEFSRRSTFAKCW